MVAPSPESYDPRWFELLDRIEDRHFWFAARRRVVGTLAGQAMKSAPPGSWVLEIGCGNGGLLPTLQSACPGAHVVGMDLHPQALVNARRRSDATLVEGDATRQPFDRPFRLVGLFDVIEHLPDDAAVLRDARGLLESGGALLVTVPAHPALWSEFDEASNHQRRYTSAGLRRVLQAAGLEVEYLTQFMAPLLPIMWLKRRGKKHDPADELRIVPGVNALMNAALAFEVPLIRRGWKLPFGTSLVALARKA